VPINVACECGHTFQAPDEDAGGSAQCPACGREQPVPKPVYVAGDDFAGVSPVEVRTSGKAIASMILGIPSLGCTFFTGAPAIILGVLGLTDIASSKGRLKGRGMAITGIVTGALGCVVIPFVMLGLLVPAMQSAREAARRVQCMSQLREIGIALQQFHDQENHFPPAVIRDSIGTPILSWRVALLPYLNEKELYEQFHLDEPWDSAYNSSLLSKMPKVYACPSFLETSKDPTLTTYQVLVGPRSAFENAVGTRFADFTDGMANTILVVEAANGVPWTKPEDLRFDPNGPLPAWGSKHPGGFNAVFGDATVRFIKSATAAATLRALVTRNGDEVVDRDAL
jgi:hypothetical protein